MIKISGENGKSIIADAIQRYNGAEIYSYYDELIPFEHYWNVDSNKYTVKEFCEDMVANIKKQVAENENSPLNMVIKLFECRPKGSEVFLPAVKLSDVEGKHTGYPDEVDLCLRMLRLK